MLFGVNKSVYNAIHEEEFEISEKDFDVKYSYVNHMKTKADANTVY